MSAESAADAVLEGRVSTGTPGLDAMLEGGLLSRRPYLIVGPSGTGKTTLALQFLLDGIRQRERVLLVTIEEPPNEIRINHRLLGPELLKVEVFDAIPDIMRYERVPFKDIASVRQAAPFGEVPLEIRRSPELTAVEVTMTALEQMLRSELQRRTYSRVVIDSLTALQYFCMKGFDPVAGAQAFLRFLSDLRVTTILTVESPLEDVDTPERMLARGEIRLFRWELEGRTVRAIGVEKFRGSSHDVRLHPYRIGPQGLDINLAVTISRDTRQIIEAARPAEAEPATVAVPRAVEEVISPLDPLAEEVRDLVLVGAEVAPLRLEIEAALRAAADGDVALARGRLSRANALVIGLSDSLGDRMKETLPAGSPVAEAYQRILQRSEAARAGMPPTKLPPPRLLEVQLRWVLSLLPEAPSVAAEPSAPAVEAPAVPSPVPEAPIVPEEVTVSVEPEPAAAPGEEVPPIPDAAPELAVTESTASEAPVIVPAVAAEPAAQVGLLPSEGPPRSGPEVAAPVPEGPTPEEAPLSPLPAGPTPATTDASSESAPEAPAPEEIVPEPAPVPSPSEPTLGPDEGPRTETVDRILAPADTSPAAVEPAETRAVRSELLPSAAPPSAEAGPARTPEVEPAPSAAAEAVSPPTLETLPPPPSRDEGVPLRPLRAWSPPALPTAARRAPAPPPPAEIAGPPPPAPSAMGPAAAVARGRANERRPPLPTSLAERPPPAERHQPLETVRESRPTRPPTAPVPPVVPPRPTTGAPAPTVASVSPPPAPAPAAAPASTAAAPVKRKRKPRAPSARKRTSASAFSVGPSALPSVTARKGELSSTAPGPLPSAEEAPAKPPPARPKRRPARKRKAPRVVAAHPAPAPAAEASAGSSAPPPLPTPPTPPPTDNPAAEESP